MEDGCEYCRESTPKLRSISQFVSLWSIIQTVTLMDERDAIVWNITADGQYSAVQFFGRLRQPQLEHEWHIRAEDKIKFFFCLML
jgi:hypothetical protein